MRIVSFQIMKPVWTRACARVSRVVPNRTVWRTRKHDENPNCPRPTTIFRRTIDTTLETFNAVLSRPRVRGSGDSRFRRPSSVVGPATLPPWDSPRSPLISGHKCRPVGPAAAKTITNHADSTEAAIARATIRTEITSGDGEQNKTKNNDNTDGSPYTVYRNKRPTSDANETKRTNRVRYEYASVNVDAGTSIVFYRSAAKFYPVRPSTPAFRLRPRAERTQSRRGRDPVTRAHRSTAIIRVCIQTRSTWCTRSCCPCCSSNKTNGTISWRRAITIVRCLNNHSDSNR